MQKYKGNKFRKARFVDPIGGLAAKSGLLLLGHNMLPAALSYRSAVERGTPGGLNPCRRRPLWL